MSTKNTLAHGDTFHLYSEALGSDHVYLELDTTHFEAGYGRVMMEIAIHIWEVIRKRGGAQLDLVGKSDSELQQMVERRVDDRIGRHQEAIAKGLGGASLGVLRHSFAYGAADSSRDEQIKAGVRYYREKRQHQNEVHARIMDLEQEQSPFRPAQT